MRRLFKNSACVPSPRLRPSGHTPVRRRIAALGAAHQAPARGFRKRPLSSLPPALEPPFPLARLPKPHFGLTLPNPLALAECAPAALPQAIYSAASLTDVLFADNTALRNGGGLSASSTRAVSSDGCTFSRNTAMLGAGGGWWGGWL
jgi:predicted outer membrane repeat protein